jgi:hypothetical protein
MSETNNHVSIVRPSSPTKFRRHASPTKFGRRPSSAKSNHELHPVAPPPSPIDKRIDHNLPEIIYSSTEFKGDIYENKKIHSESVDMCIDCGVEIDGNWCYCECGFPMCDDCQVCNDDDNDNNRYCNDCCPNIALSENMEPGLRWEESMISLKVDSDPPKLPKSPSDTHWTANIII